MAKEKNKKEEEVLEVTPTEEIAEVGFANIDQALVVQNITQATLTAMKEEFMVLKIHGLDDKEGYKLVDEKRKLCKKTRVLAKDICEKGRAHAIAEQKAWIAKQKEVVDQITEVEEYLEAQVKVIDDEKKRIKEEQDQIEQTRLQNRTVQLLQLGMTLQGDNYVLNGIMINTLHVKIYDDFTYGQILSPVLVEAEKVKAEKEEEARIKAEEDAAFKKLQEEQRLEREKLDRDRAEFEASQKKAKEIEDARIKAAEEEKAAIEKQKADLQIAKVTSRTKTLYSLGMSFNGTDFVFGPIVMSKEVLSTCSDTEFDQHVENMTPLINARKAAIEKQREEETEAEKNKAVAKALADFEAARKAEADEKARAEAKHLNEEEIARMLEEGEAAKKEAMKSDSDKYADFVSKLQNLPVPEFSTLPYQNFSTVVKTTIGQLIAHLGVKRPK
jgi:hypothetical protein